MSVRITDYGMDQVAAVASSQPSISHAYFERWHRYTAIGTGSSTPAQTDVALEAEVARTQDNGGFQRDEVFEADASANVVRFRSTTYRVFNISASYNLTEYGHFINSSGSNAVFRDLFRQDPNDPNSTAITISVQDGDQLQIIKTFIIEIPWTEETKTVTISGIGDVAGTQVFGVSSNADIYLRYTFTSLWPGETSYQRAWWFDGPVTAGRADELPSSSLGDIPNDSDWVNGTADPYTPGSHIRRKRFKWETSEGNTEWYGWCFGGYDLYSNTPRRASFRFIFDTQPGFTKADTHTLEIWLDVSWARG